MPLLERPARSGRATTADLHRRRLRQPFRRTVLRTGVIGGFAVAGVLTQADLVEASASVVDSLPPSDSTEPESAPAAPSGFPPALDGFPSPDNTGPRVGMTTSSAGSLSTTADDAVIERVVVNGRLTIRHDNVIVRDVVVMGTTTYMIHIEPKADGECPSNVQIEHVEVNGENAPADAIAVYGGDCGYTFDHGYIHNVGRGVQAVDDVVVTNSYVHATRTWEGAHRNAITTNGGKNLRILNNSLFCENTGCSAAVALYGGRRPVEDVLVQGNLMSTTGRYCMYGGSVPSKPYEGSNIRILDNSFSTALGGRCGRSGPLNGFDDDVRGNQFSGNVWHETGEPVTV